MGMNWLLQHTNKRDSFLAWSKWPTAALFMFQMSSCNKRKKSSKKQKEIGAEENELRFCCCFLCPAHIHISCYLLSLCDAFRAFVLKVAIMTCKWLYGSLPALLLPYTLSVWLIFKIVNIQLQSENTLRQMGVIGAEE
jgi:hypothetical protein